MVLPRRGTLSRCNRGVVGGFMGLNLPSITFVMGTFKAVDLAGSIVGHWNRLFKVSS
jgi:hypothetical protein